MFPEEELDGIDWLLDGAGVLELDWVTGAVEEEVKLSINEETESWLSRAEEIGVSAELLATIEETGFWPAGFPQAIKKVDDRSKSVLVVLRIVLPSRAE